MGHQRLGWLPLTHRWQDVVGLIAGGGSAAEVADATLTAAQKGLAKAVKDPGVKHVVWLLAHTVMAARAADFAVALCELGVPVRGPPTTFELVGAVSEAIDHYMATEGCRTDFGEMAQLAAAESLVVLVGTHTPTLFDAPVRSVRDVMYDLSTRSGFASLGHDFFRRLTRRFLEYHLSRELSCHVGRGGRFADVSDHGRFLERLDVTCQEAALVVRDYAGDWYSLAKFTDGVSRQQVGKFVETSFTKLAAELRRRGRDWRPDPTVRREGVDRAA